VNISYFILGSLIINIFMLVSFFQYVVLEHFNLILFFFLSLCLYAGYFLGHMPQPLNPIVLWIGIGNSGSVFFIPLFQCN